ncbi:MAG: hypothetical protein JST81_07135 [Bacteroidetes bacterium]|jgi:hypothetical protein|nr:hypothetical protein [Bacteroidota bacterium]
MKKIFFGILAAALLSTAAVYADNGKKPSKKQCKGSCKKEHCDKSKCDKSKCDKSTCAKMPGCHKS